MQASETRAGIGRPACRYSWAVRAAHWANAISLTVLAMSGLQIFYAFPSFGPKVPQLNLVDDIPHAVRLGGWLGGALQWHFTFMWIFAGAGLLYVVSHVVSGRYRTVLFVPADIPGVWPMIRHYFLFGPRPRVSEQYNPLQKLAYTSTLVFGALSLATGMVMYKPVQLSALGTVFGGFHGARLVHFLSMCGLLAFIPGHLVMVVIHGWDNLQSMFTGWTRRPDDVAAVDGP